MCIRSIERHNRNYKKSINKLFPCQFVSDAAQGNAVYLVGQTH